MGWFKRKEYFCRHPTCTKTFDTKEGMLKHYYPAHEGCPYVPEKEKEIKEIDVNVLETEDAIYKRRLISGESEASAKSGLKHIKNLNEKKSRKLILKVKKMTDNNPNEDWIDAEEKPKIAENEKYEKFYYKWKRRLARGENPDTASIDAPDGFTEWLKSRNKMIK